MFSKLFLLKSSAIALSAVLFGATASQAMESEKDVEVAKSPQFKGYHYGKSLANDSFSSSFSQPYVGFGFPTHKEETKESPVVLCPNTHIHYTSNPLAADQYAFSTSVGADGKIIVHSHLQLQEPPFILDTEYRYTYYRKDKPAASSQSVIGLKFEAQF